MSRIQETGRWRNGAFEIRRIMLPDTVRLMSSCTDLQAMNWLSRICRSNVNIHTNGANLGKRLIPSEM